MFLSDACLFFFFCCARMFIELKMNKDWYYRKTANFLLKATIRGLLVETFDVLSVPRMW